jgi:iron complex transport system substrate-binding protein
MRRLALVLLACTLLAACGSEAIAPRPRSAAERSSAGRDFPAVIAAPNGPVRLRERPHRVVSLSPSATEMLFAVDAADQVIAVDDNSDYPPRAPTTRLSGYEPNIEAIASYDPDLVVVSDDIGNVVGALERLKIPVIVQPAPARLRDVYAQIQQLGAATGNPEAAHTVVVRMRARVRDIVAAAPAVEPATSYYHELDQTYFSVTSDTFIGRIYGLFGLRNIADTAKGAGSAYPQLSAEHIIESDPDLIFLADTKCCGMTSAKVAARPGWDRLSAVEAGHVHELDDDVASRWGPRIVELVRTVARAVAQLEGGPT